MLKFATLKDTHLRFGFDKPIGRTESFFQEVEVKFDFVLQLCIDQGIKYLLVPGDIFDVKAPHKYSMVQLSAMMRFFHKFKTAGVEWITIAGNHDLPFSSASKKSQSIYQFMANHNIINDVVEVPLIVDNQYCVTGIDYQSPESGVFLQLECLNESLDPNKTNIVMLHQHFVPEIATGLDFVSFFRYSDLQKYDNIDVFVLGHLHKGYPIQTLTNANGKKQTFINQWSPIRLTRDYYSVDDQHIPTVTWYDGDKFRTTKIPCGDYASSFNEQEVKHDETFAFSLQEFFKKMGTSNLMEEDEAVVPPEDIKSKVDHYLEKIS